MTVFALHAFPVDPVKLSIGFLANLVWGQAGGIVSRSMLLPHDGFSTITNQRFHCLSTHAQASSEGKCMNKCAA